MVQLRNKFEAWVRRFLFVQVWPGFIFPIFFYNCDNVSEDNVTFWRIYGVSLYQNAYLGLFNLQTSPNNLPKKPPLTIGFACAGTWRQAVESLSSQLRFMSSVWNFAVATSFHVKRLNLYCCRSFVSNRQLLFQDTPLKVGMISQKDQSQKDFGRP